MADPHKTADIKKKLVDRMKGILRTLPEKERVKVLENLMAYFDTNPPVEDLMDSTKIIRQVLNPQTFEQSHIDQKPL